MNSAEFADMSRLPSLLSTVDRTEGLLPMLFLTLVLLGGVSTLGQFVSNDDFCLFGVEAVPTEVEES